MRLFKNFVVLIIFMLETLIVAREFEEEILKLHNEYRKKHYAADLLMDTFLSETATNCVLTILQYNKRLCTDNGMYGINTYNLESQNDLTAEHVFLTWYNTGANYDYLNEPKADNETNPFTQIVWKGTRRLGVAFLTGNGRDVVVAVYSPPGNALDMYLDNVSALRKE